MKIILTTNNYRVLVDDEDYEFLSKTKWRADKARNTDRYAVASNSRSSRDRMHRIILSAKDGEIVDHISGDTLDNRKSNLRIVTRSQNAINSKPRKNRELPRGVTCVKSCQHGKWFIYYQANVYLHNKRYYIGSFKTIHEARIAYIKHAKELHGEYYRE